MKPRFLLTALVLAAAGSAGFFLLRDSPPEPSHPETARPKIARPAATGPLGTTGPHLSAATKPQRKVVTAASLKPADLSGLTPEEQEQREKNKEIDRDHLTKIRAGVFAWREKYGTYPEYLSQLVPEFISAEVLISPQKKPGGRDFADLDHPDPGLAEPSYGYEFSNLEFRDGRTFAEIKEVQRAEWGDTVPVLRCFAYDGTVINMAYGGEIYETALNWEWDPATMDVVDKLGWGPGLDAGDMVKVRVLNPDGSPAAGAEVWADGRNYSFDLPHRPYATDEDGWVSIPVGADIDRTRLALRAETPGLTSRVISYPAGELPENPSLQLAPAVNIGGTAEDGAGNLVSGARIYLRTADGDGQSQGLALSEVLSDDSGTWQASVHPDDAAALSAVMGTPGSMVKFLPGTPLDPGAAGQNAAVVVPTAP